jgi:hypothetical protein
MNRELSAIQNNGGDGFRLSDCRYRTSRSAITTGTAAAIKPGIALGCSILPRQAAAASVTWGRMG